MLTMKEARDGFIIALEAEIEVAQKDDIVFEYMPTQKLSKGSNGVYLTFKPPVSPSLNEYQADAVIRALNNDLTFIWGPPGTGKSRTISELIVQYLIAGESVLFISQSNIAVDIVRIRKVENRTKNITSASQLKGNGLKLERVRVPLETRLPNWKGGPLSSPPLWPRQVLQMLSEHVNLMLL